MGVWVKNYGLVNYENLSMGETLYLELGWLEKYGNNKSLAKSPGCERF